MEVFHLVSYHGFPFFMLNYQLPTLLYEILVAIIPFFPYFKQLKLVEIFLTLCLQVLRFRPITMLNTFLKVF